VRTTVPEWNGLAEADSVVTDQAAVKIDANSTLSGAEWEV